MENIKVISEIYPDAIENDKINYNKLIVILAQEVFDLQEELNEKDYQILHLTNEIDALKR